MSIPKIKPSDILIKSKDVDTIESSRDQDDEGKDVTLESWLSGDKPISEGKKKIYKKHRPHKDIDRFDKADPYEIGRRMRAGFWNGTMELCHRQRKALHEVIADWLERDPQGTFKMMSGFFPKQIDNNIGGDLVSYLKEVEKNRGASEERVISVQREDADKSSTEDNAIRPGNYLLHTIDED